MKVVVQRVENASVSVKNNIIGKIEKGYLLLVGFHTNDNDDIIDYVVNKIINLRIFDDEFGIMNKNIIETSGNILSISQFTLYANTKKGNRPNYINSMSSNLAINLYNKFNDKLRIHVKNLQTGEFGKEMKVSLVNDGPVTIIIEKENEI